MKTIEELVQIANSTGLIDNVEKFDPNATFSDNGVDSLDTMAVLLAIEEAVGVKFSEDELSEVNSIHDIFKVLSTRNA